MIFAQVCLRMATIKSHSKICSFTEHAVVYADPEQPKHAQWVSYPVSMLAMQELGCFSFQELCTDPCNMGPCIIMLQHEVMVMDEWHNNGPQYLITVSLCIQNAINEMHLCSLSITYACPYHNPTTTMGHSNYSMPIARSLKTCNICGIVLCDKTAHFRVAFYCGQPKAHLCNYHAV